MSDEIGFKIDIPDEVFNDLAQVDMAIKNIAETAKKTSTAVSREFGNMAGSAGLLAFMNQLKTAKTLMGDLGSNNAGQKAISDIGATMSTSSEDAKGFLTQISSIAESLNNLYASQKGGHRETASLIDLSSINIAETSTESLSEKIKTVKKLLTENRVKFFDDTQRQNAKNLTEELTRLQVAYGDMVAAEKKASGNIKITEGSIAAYNKEYGKLQATFKKTGDVNTFNTAIDALNGKYEDIAKQATLAGVSINGVMTLTSDVRKSLAEGIIPDLNIGELKQAKDYITALREPFKATDAEAIKYNETLKQVNTQIKAISDSTKATSSTKVKDVVNIDPNSIDAITAKIKELKAEQTSIGIVDSTDKEYNQLLLQQIDELVKKKKELQTLDEPILTFQEAMAKSANTTKELNEKIKLLQKAASTTKLDTDKWGITAEGVAEAKSMVLAIENLKKEYKELTTVAETPLDYHDIEEMSESSVKELDAKIDELKKYQEVFNVSNETDRVTNKNLLLYIQSLIDKRKELSTLSAEPLTLVQIDEMAEESVNDLTKKIEALKEYQGSVNIVTDDEIADNQKLLKQIEKYEAKLKSISKYKISVDDALQASQDAKSIAQRVDAINKLTIARDNLEKKDSSYDATVKKLNDAIKQNTKLNNDATGAINNQAKSQSKLLDISGQLARQAALFFSVSQIKGYIKKLAKVRGEFELQQKSLQAIMQDKYQADKVWAQIVDLSVQSPFRLKELTSYTKQLAAYRIESEKVFDVTKMLADVSAGLGVDMSRLILAYGQVKAANYLRGTELRQFSEAGINILGELSKYFTELEGRAISTADVFEMVSKRMVSFDDVNTIFERLTQTGGIFYNMQEIQAETLAGKISNLGDAYDIMLNKIGKDNEGILKGGIDSIRSLLENYEEVLDALKALAWPMAGVTTALVSAKVASSGWGKAIANVMGNMASHSKRLEDLAIGFYDVNKGTTVATKGTRLFATALSGLTTIGVVAVIAAITYGITQFYLEETKASRLAKRLKEDLDELFVDRSYEANKLVSKFEYLAESILTATDGSKDQKDALDELTRTYGDILPAQSLTIEGLREMKGAYDSVTSAIYSKIEAQMREEQITAVEDTYGKEAQNAQQVLSKYFTEQLGLVTIDANSVAKQFVSDITKSLDKKLEVTDPEAFKKASKSLTDTGAYLAEQIKTYSGIVLSDTQVDALTDIYKKSETQYDSSGKAIVTTISKYEDWDKEILNVINSVTNLDTQLKNLDNYSQVGFTADYRSIDAEFEAVKKVVVDKKAELSDLMKGTDTFLISQKQIDEEIAIYRQFIDDIKSGNKEIKNINTGVSLSPTSDTVLKYLSDVENKIKDLEGSDTAKAINNIKKNIDGINWGKLSFTQFDDEVGYKGYVEGLNKAIESYKSTLAKLDSGVKIPELELKDLLGDKTVDEFRSDANKIIELRNRIASEVGTGGESQTEKTFKAQISLLKTMNSEYENLRKKFSVNESFDNVMKSYEDSIRELNTIEGFDFSKFMSSVKGLTDEDIRDVLKSDTWNNVASSIGKDAMIALAKTMGDYQVGLDIDTRIEGLEALSNDIDSAFGDYEMTMQLQGLDFDKDMANNLFDFDYVSLDDLKKNIDKLFEGRDGAVFTEGGLLDLEKSSEEIVKEYKSALGQISDYQVKEQEAANKRVYEVLQKSYTEREKLAKQKAKDLALIQTSEFDKATKDAAVLNVELQFDKDSAKLDYDEFKATDEYIMAFEDLDNFGETTINHLISVFRDFAKTPNLEPEVVKTLNTQLQKLENTALNFNPFKGIVQDLKDYSEATRDAKDATKELEAVQSVELSIPTLKTTVAEAQTTRDTAQSIYDSTDIANTDAMSIALDNLLASEIALIEAEADLAAAKKTVADAETKLTDAENKRAKALNNAKDRMVKLQDEYDAFANIVTESINIVSEFADGLGLSFSDETQAALDGIAKGIALVATGLGVVSAALTAIEVLGWRVSASLWWMVGIAAALAAVFAIVGAADAKRDATIDSETRKVALLQSAYEDLETQFEQAYTTSDLESTTDAMLNNIDAQIDALEKARAAEMDKKSSDQDAIDDYNEQIADLYDQALAAQYELTRELGGIGEDEWKSTAQSFIEAWEDAFLETGDGLSGLEEEFDELILNMVRSAALSKAMDSFMTPVFTMIDDAVAGGVSDEEMAEILAKADEIMPQLSEFLEEFYTGLDIASDVDSDTSELSGLQQGITSLTESTGVAIEAYLNSIRFEVFRQGEVLNAMLLAMQAVASLNNVENSIIYQELVKQTTLLRSIDNRIESVIGDGATSYLKTNL